MITSTPSYLVFTPELRVCTYFTYILAFGDHALQRNLLQFPSGIVEMVRRVQVRAAVLGRGEALDNDRSEVGLQVSALKVEHGKPLHR